MQPSSRARHDAIASEVVREPIDGPEGFQPHHHICLLYDDGQEQQASMASFMGAGLQRGEACFYIADHHTPEQVVGFMERQGVEAERAVKEGRLAVVTKRDTYLRQGYFDPDAMIGFVRSTVEASVKGGAPACRVTGEMTWALGPEPGTQRVLEYEARINEVFRQLPLVAVCQYDMRRFDAATLVEVVQTHPLVMVHGRICRNFYYVPPEEALAGRRREVELRRLVENLVAREEQERERVVSERRAAELERLRAAEQARAEFINVAAHELGNPLTPLGIQVSLLRTRHADGLSPKQRELVGVIERNVDRLTDLVQDLLEVTRLQAGSVRLEPGPMDLGRSVRETLEACADMAQSRGVAFQTDLGKGLEVHADVRRLTQVLYNLLGNAVKYTPPGGHVRVQARREADEAVVEVRDSGVGIAAGDLPRLFQPFVRLGDTGAQRGTGLGLYVSKGLVELHGGRIWASSEGPGKGSTFGFAVPVRGPAQPLAVVSRLPAA